jgi:hypothetical protein
MPHCWAMVHSKSASAVVGKRAASSASVFIGVHLAMTGVNGVKFGVDFT